MKVRLDYHLNQQIIYMKHIFFFLTLSTLLIFSCQKPEKEIHPVKKMRDRADMELDIAQANRLAELPLKCIDTRLPYKPGHTLTSVDDLDMPYEHHPAFYGCFDWHSAVHGHWSLVYLLKTFPDLERKQEARDKLNLNLTKENLQRELAYFSLNKYTKTFERTYGWAWLLKLQEELYTWDNPDAQRWYTILEPLAQHIAASYIVYLPNLVYPIRVGEHSNTAFGLSFAYDYAMTIGDQELATAIQESAIRFYMNDHECPISWEPSGYDFLSPCLQEMEIMKKILSEQQFKLWLEKFLPDLTAQNFTLMPGKIIDRTDGKMVHLDGLNFSRAWCLYMLDENDLAINIAEKHMNYSLNNITDGEYAGEHWLASFALYAFKTRKELSY